MLKECEIEDLEYDLEENEEILEELRTEVQDMHSNQRILEKKETEIEELKKMLEFHNMELSGKDTEIVQLMSRKMWLQHVLKTRKRKSEEPMSNGKIGKYV